MKTPEQFAATREYVATGLAKIRAALPEDGDVIFACRVIEETLGGFDPRIDLGIEPIERKGGAPALLGDRNIFLAAWYVSLRKSEPLEKTAASIVAEAFGLAKPGTVRAIAKKHMKTAELLVASMPAAEIAEAAQLHARVHRERAPVKR